MLLTVWKLGRRWTHGTGYRQGTVWRTHRRLSSTQPSVPGECVGLSHVALRTLVRGGINNHRETAHNYKETVWYIDWFSFTHFTVNKQHYNLINWQKIINKCTRISHFSGKVLVYQKIFLDYWTSPEINCISASVYLKQSQTDLIFWHNTLWLTIFPIYGNLLKILSLSWELWCVVEVPNERKVWMNEWQMCLCVRIPLHRDKVPQ